MIYFQNSTKNAASLGKRFRIIKIGNFKIINSIVSVYPDHGESFLGDSEIHSFEVSARKYKMNEIQEELELNFYDEFIVFSFN